MKTLILGAGTLGFGVAKRLQNFGESVTLVEKSERAADIATAVGIDVVIGDALQPETLEKAGIEDAIHVVSVLSQDEQNLVACRWAESLFGGTKMARLRSEVFRTTATSGYSLKEKFGVDVVIRPLEETSSFIGDVIRINGALEAVLLDDIAVVKIKCPAGAEVLNTPFRYLYRIIDPDVAVLTVTRGGKTFRLQMDDVLLEEDEVYLAAHRNHQNEALKSFGYDQSAKQRLLLIGASKRWSQLIGDIRGSSDVEVGIFEESLEQAERISLNFPDITTINGDYLDYDLLKDASSGIDVALVSSDRKEHNVLLSLLLKKNGVKRILTLIHDRRYEALLTECSIIDPDFIAAESVVNRILPRKSQSIFELGGGDFCVVAAEVTESCPKIGHSFSSMGVEEAVFPIFICKNSVVNSISSKIAVGDRLLLLAEKKSVGKLKRSFSCRSY
jgi:trk system potassium uptake protein TrkA